MLLIRRPACSSLFASLPMPWRPELSFISVLTGWWQLSQKHCTRHCAPAGRWQVLQDVTRQLYVLIAEIISNNNLIPKVLRLIKNYTRNSVFFLPYSIGVYILSLDPYKSGPVKLELAYETCSLQVSDITMFYASFCTLNTILKDVILAFNEDILYRNKIIREWW